MSKKGVLSPQISGIFRFFFLHAGWVLIIQVQGLGALSVDFLGEQKKYREKIMVRTRQNT